MFRELRWGNGVRLAFVLAALSMAALLGAACGDDDNAAEAPAEKTEAAAAPSEDQVQAADLIGGVDVKAEPGDEPLKLAFFGLDAANPYTTSAAEGVKEAVEALGNDSSFTSFDGNFDAQHQLSQIHDAVATGRYNAFVLLPNDPTIVVPGVERAIEEDIKVGTTVYPIGPEFTIVDRAQVPGVTMTLVNNVVTDGEITGERANEICADKDPCKIVVLLGDRSLLVDVERLNALKKTIAPNVEIISTCDGGYLQEGGFKCMQDALQIDSEIDVILTPAGDEMITGAQSALEAAGIKVGEDNPDGMFQLIGLGANEDAVQRVRDGEWDSSRVYLANPTLSTIMVQALSDHVNGRGDKWPEAFDVDELSPIGALATQETLAEAPEFKGEWCC
jgi:ribose transport system substrate-binding protein